MPIELRTYQQDAIARTQQAEADGVRRQLGVAATGLGKTIIFASLAQLRGGRTLILAHRDELVTQAVAKVRQVWPGVDVGIVKAGQNDVTAQVVVASVQTLARSKRMAQLCAPWSEVTLLGKADPFDLIVVDEAHHATADSYRDVLFLLRAGEPEKCRCGHDEKSHRHGDETCSQCPGGGTITDGTEPCFQYNRVPPGPLLLGVTATPDRGDGKGLKDMFDRVVWSYDVLWGIGEGYLSDLRGVRCTVKMNTADLKVSRGDYEAGAAGQALEDAHAPEVIFRSWCEHAAGRRTLVFTPTVHLAQLVAQRFNVGEIRAAFVSGETPMDERRDILKRYSAGEIEVLANCAVLTEGYDEPRTDCIVVARPTKSRALYAQMVGRGTRRHPDKVDCLVLDVVGASRDHSLLTIPTLFGIDAKELEKGTEGVAEVAHRMARELQQLGVLSAEEADLFAAVRRDGIAWVAVHRPGDPARYERKLSMHKEAHTVVLAQARPGTPLDGRWVAAVSRPDGITTVFADDESMELVQGVAEDYVRRYGERSVVRADASWRQGDPTYKQLEAARKWRLKINPDWTAGELGDALTAHIAQVKAKRRKPVKRP